MLHTTVLRGSLYAASRAMIVCMTRCDCAPLPATSTVASAATVPCLYGIAQCDTVKKARQWLDAQGWPYVFHDFKKQGVPPGLLMDWLRAVGHERLLNRQGTTWRKLDAATQARVQDDASAAAVLLEHPSAIKRPVVRWPDGSVTVGFQAQLWAGKQPAADAQG